MTTGDIVNPKRVRWVANERVDGVDADTLSAELIEHVDALTRAELFTPRAAGGSAPTGMILTGFGLTLNPTGGADGKVRIVTALGIALDADGRRIIKPAGTTIDVSIPAGTYQLYAYWTEAETDTASRRFIAVSTPFAESSKSTNTLYQASYGFHTRAGNASSIVASDNVNGTTRALVCLGVVTNTAGAISCTGYNSSTAPNGTGAVNRIGTVSVPTSSPTTQYASGSQQTLHDMVLALAYQVGQLGWKGSKNSAPAASNNYNAFTPPTVAGVDALFDAQAEATYTPITKWREYKNQYNRAVVDHLGYRGGQVSEFAERWQAASTSDPNGWTFSNGGGAGTRLYDDPVSGFPYRNVKLALVGPGTDAATLTGLPVAYVSDDTAYVAELDVMTGPASWTGSNSIQFAWIVEFSHAAAWDRYMKFNINPASSAFVTAVAMAGGTVDTAAAVAVSTVYRMRIEIIGSNNSSQAAGTYVARLFMNGVLALTQTFTMAAPTTDPIRHELSLNTPTGFPGAYVRVGPLRHAWNHRLTPDNL